MKDKTPKPGPQDRTRSLLEIAESRKKEIEADMNHAQEIAHIGTWRMNVVKNELLWSDEAYRIFEVPSGTHLNYEMFLSFVHPDDRKKVDDKWQKALLGDKYDIDHRILVDGKLKWVRETAMLELDNTGKLLGGFGTVQDITDRKNMEKQLYKKNESLIKINGLLKDFVNIAAHDLRSPVSSIMMMSEYIKMQKSVSEKEKAFDHLMQLAQKLQRTIDGLLEMVDVQIDQKTNFINIRFEDLFNDILSDYSDEIERYHVKIEADFSNTPQIAYVEAYLKSIMKNLLSNAIKYSSETVNPLVRISAKKEKGFVLMEITDNGIGFNIQDAGEDLFKPFRRFTTKAEGTGMGLYIVKNIIEKNGGRVSIKSIPNEGTALYCYLKEYNAGP